MTAFDPEDVSYERNVRPVSKIKEQLADLENVEALALKFGTPDFASQVGMIWMTRHKRSLVNEMRVSQLLESGDHSNIVGTLAGSDIDLMRFELQAGTERYLGLVSEEALSQLRLTPIGAEVNAKVKVVVTSQGDSVTPPLVAYLLETIEMGASPFGPSGA